VESGKRLQRKAGQMFVLDDDVCAFETKKKDKLIKVYP